MWIPGYPEVWKESFQAPQIMGKSSGKTESCEWIPATITSPLVPYPAEGVRSLTLMAGTVEEAQRNGEDVKREALRLTTRINRGLSGPSDLFRLLEYHPGILLDPEVREKTARLVHSARFRRGKGHRELGRMFRRHPLLVLGMVKRHQEEGQTQSLGQIFEWIAREVHLETESVKNLYHQALHDSRFKPLMVFNDWRRKP